MARIAARSLPPHALLGRYAGTDHYTDCYMTELPGDYTHAEFITAFYTTWLFRLERAVLRWLVAKPSTDDDAVALARGDRDTFAAWQVEARAPNQLLLCDFLGNTRSWLMVEPGSEGGVTRLYFGSAVVAREQRRSGGRRPRRHFRALLGVHRHYSHALLAAARSRLQCS